MMLIDSEGLLVLYYSGAVAALPERSRGNFNWILKVVKFSKPIYRGVVVGVWQPNARTKRSTSALLPYQFPP